MVLAGEVAVEVEEVVEVEDGVVVEVEQDAGGVAEDGVGGEDEEDGDIMTGLMEVMRTLIGSMILRITTKFLSRLQMWRNHVKTKL
jgi:hypothetical protein